MHEIIPAILPKSTEDLEQQARELPGSITSIHLDVLEDDVWGEFNQDFEAHLMVKEPEKIAHTWIERGAKRLIVHSLSGEFTKFRDRAEIGLGIELKQNLDEIWPLIDLVDFVHFMSIEEIGAQGHPFSDLVFDRIKAVQEKHPELPISVDGGVNIFNYEKLIETGADRLVVGSGFKELWHHINGIN